MIGRVDAITNPISVHEFVELAIARRLQIDAFHRRVEVVQVGELFVVRGEHDSHVGVGSRLDAFEHLATYRHAHAQALVVARAATQLVDEHERVVGPILQDVVDLDEISLERRRLAQRCLVVTIPTAA